MEGHCISRVSVTSNAFKLEEVQRHTVQTYFGWKCIDSLTEKPSSAASSEKPRQYIATSLNALYLREGQTLVNNDEERLHTSLKPVVHFLKSWGHARRIHYPWKSLYRIRYLRISLLWIHIEHECSIRYLMALSIDKNIELGYPPIPRVITSDRGVQSAISLRASSAAMTSSPTVKYQERWNMTFDNYTYDGRI